MKKLSTIFLACLLCGFTSFGQQFKLPEGPAGPGQVRILCIGNSFTYVHGTDLMLQQIASSQGLEFVIGKYLAGGYTFGRHLENEESRQAVAFGGYDYAFLQDQSANPARYSRDKDKTVLEDFKALKRNVLAASPGCKVFLERTWSYGGFEAGGFGTKESLEYHLVRGARKMGRKGHAKVSPIGDAFEAALAARPDLKLLGPDDHHQSLEGAYLKACVNYLLIVGKPFSGEPDCCGVDPEVAAFLRSVAEKTVLAK